MTRLCAMLVLLAACGIEPDSDLAQLGETWEGDAALPAELLAPPTMQIDGVRAATGGDTILWRVTGGGLAAGDLVLLGLGTSQGPGFCPPSAFGNVCLDIVGGLRVLGRVRAMTTPAGNVAAVFRITVPPGTSGSAFVQAFRATGPASETSEVRSLYITNTAEPRVFVTDGGYKPGNGSFIGVDGADGICQAEASASGMPFPEGWHALLSTRDVGAAERSRPVFPMYNAALDVVANDAADLWDGDIGSPILRASGAANFGVGWTGTNPDGTSTGQTSPIQTLCDDWTSTAGAGDCGRSNETDTRWTSVYWPGTPSNACNNTLPFYCVLGTGCPAGTTAGPAVGECIPVP